MSKPWPLTDTSGSLSRLLRKAGVVLQDMVATVTEKSVRWEGVRGTLWEGYEEPLMVFPPGYLETQQQGYRVEKH